MRFRAPWLGLHGFARRRRSPPHYRVIGMLDCRDRLLFDTNLEGPRYVVARTVHGSGKEAPHSRGGMQVEASIDITEVEAPQVRDAAQPISQRAFDVRARQQPIRRSCRSIPGRGSMCVPVRSSSRRHIRSAPAQFVVGQRSLGIGRVSRVLSARGALRKDCGKSLGTSQLKWPSCRLISRYRAAGSG